MGQKVSAGISPADAIVLAKKHHANVLAARKSAAAGRKTAAVLATSTPNVARIKDIFFQLSAKFRGYGAPTSDGSQTEDTPIAPNGFGQSGASAFPDMELPLDVTFDGDSSTAFGFARVQHLVDVPDTVVPGDIVEIAPRLFLDFTLPQGYFNGLAQFMFAKYKWVVPPYNIDPNTGLQFTGVEAQPRTDDGPFEP